MPRYEKMPDGSTVAVPDDISPDALNRVRAKYTPKPTTRVERRQARQTTQEVNVPQTRQQRRVAEIKKKIREPDTALGRFAKKYNETVDPTKWFGGNVGSGAYFNFDDEVSGIGGAIGAIPEAISKGSFKPISEGYRANQIAADEVKAEYARDNPGKALLGQAIGGLAVPVAGTGKALHTLSNGARSIGATRTATTLGRVAARQRRSGAIARGATTGAAVGALNSAGNSKDLASIPGDALEGGTVGAVLGTALGAAFRGGAAGVRAIKDRRTVAQGGTDATSARAYKRVGSLLDNIRNTDDKPIGAEEVVKGIRSANRTGADTRLMDQSAGLRAEAAYLSRDTNIPNSNRMQDLAEDRILARSGSFNDQVSKRASTKGTDARDLSEGIDAARGLKGNKDYENGGALDQPIDWTPDVNSFFEEAGPTTQAALKRAYDIMLDERRNPLELGLQDTGSFSAVPSFRTLDYLKRGYSDLIETAIGAGNRSKAGRISSEFNGLKQMLIDQNPEYGQILATQRDAFQRVQAIELGESIFQSMKTKPREALRDLRKLDGSKKDDARIGIIDRLLNLDTTADPVAAIRGYMRSRPQRRVLEFAFGSKKALDSFEKYVENEVKASLTDKFISSGRNSLTGTLKQAGYSQQEALQEVGGQAIKGFGFGGEVGLIANAIGGIKRVANSVNPEVQNEIARILISKGEDLEAGLAASAKFFAQRLARDRKTTAGAARTVATPIGGSFGDN